MASDDDLVRLILFIVAFVVLAPLLLMTVAWSLLGGRGSAHMWESQSGTHMWDNGMWGGTQPIWGWLLIWVVLFVVLLGGGYLLYRTLEEPKTNGTDAALEELRLAYARGELSDEEFEKRVSRLRSTGQQTATLNERADET